MHKKTIAVSGLMHICHGSRNEGPDGHETVAGASTNVCDRPCCYLYRAEIQTGKYLQPDGGSFMLGGQNDHQCKQMELNRFVVPEDQ